MSTSLLSFVFAAMASLAPNQDNTELGTAIAEVVEAGAPLFKDDADRRRTASFLVAVAWRESTFRLNAIGDHGRARCAFQLWSTTRDVLTDAHLCTSIAFERLHESFRVCGPSNALGIYAAGPLGCSMSKARRISADRSALARRIYSAATATLAKESSS